MRATEYLVYDTPFPDEAYNITAYEMTDDAMAAIKQFEPELKGWSETDG